MVNQQGEQLDLASDNVIAAEGNVSQARTNLATSEKVRLFLLFFSLFAYCLCVRQWMNSYRKKVIILIIIIVVGVALIVGLAVGLCKLYKTC
jgi:hypothetical protein